MPKQLLFRFLLVYVMQPGCQYLQSKIRILANDSSRGIHLLEALTRREKVLIGYSEAMEGIFSSDLFCTSALMESGQELKTTSIATERRT